MRKLIFLTTVLLCFGWVKGQQTEFPIEKGSIFILGTPSSGLEFKYIHFPKRNFIIKRGGIADYKEIIGKKVEVSQVVSSQNGETEIILKPLDGQRFFKVFPKVKADYEKALGRGELIPI
ncbi:hypothetical protein HZY62_07295 [Maribacter polysiphoniae]|uniref:Uncharacterized protein n=1 Tax=Maribacter polysiphoniae TaxID=429344 RepID=A0A316E632_9FLAO|nr:hypothetical protein [Maribacter polysiphoniae]MBD1260387.1 hypothetical protein [Maribacter polysiphoniae]PWK25851.1 hypothetical protein LX92_00595 [Maribacter polysiphoniae]